MITGLSNSSTQRQHILSVAEQRDLKNLEVLSIYAFFYFAFAELFTFADHYGRREHL